MMICRVQYKIMMTPLMVSDVFIYILFVSVDDLQRLLPTTGFCGAALHQNKLLQGWAIQSRQQANPEDIYPACKYSSAARP